MSLNQLDAAKMQSLFEDRLRQIYFKLAHFRTTLGLEGEVTMSAYTKADSDFQDNLAGIAMFNIDMADLLEALYPNEQRILSLVTTDETFGTTDGFNGVKNEIKAVLKCANALPQVTVNKLTEVIGAMVYFEYMLKLSPADESAEIITQIPEPITVIAELLRAHNGTISPFLLEGLLTALGAAEMQSATALPVQGEA